MSEQRDDGGPAFPWGEHGTHLGGLTMRDYFAAKALVGLLSEPYSPETKSSAQVVTGRSGSSLEAADIYAEAAYILADAMLKARQK